MADLKPKLEEMKEFAEVLEDNRDELVQKVIDSSRLVRKFAEFDIESIIRIFRDYDQLIEHLDSQGIDLGSRESIGKVATILPYNGPGMCFGLSFSGAFLYDSDIEVKGASESKPFFATLERIMDESNLNYTLVNSDGTNLFSHEKGKDFMQRQLDPESRTRVLEIFGHDSYILNNDGTLIKDLGDLLSQKTRDFSLILEGPGKNRFIVTYPLTDVDACAKAMVDLKTLNTGQTCMNAEIFDVDKRVLPELLPRILAYAAQVEVNDPYYPSADIGPLKNRIAERAIGQIKDALDNGAKVEYASSNMRSQKFYTGEPSNWDGQSLKYGQHAYKFLPFTVISGLKEDAKLRTDETFGPIMGIKTFGDDQEVIDSINSPIQKYGLGASIFGDDLEGRHDKLLEAVRSNNGHVYENVFMFAPGQFDILTTPWGGYKNSRLAVRAKNGKIELEPTGPQYIVMDFTK